MAEKKKKKVISFDESEKQAFEERQRKAMERREKFLARKTKKNKTTW